MTYPNYAPERLTRRNIEALARDFMCYPQVGIDPFRLPDEMFVHTLRNYIEHVVDPSDPEIDPNDPLVIY